MELGTEKDNERSEERRDGETGTASKSKNMSLAPPT
jgi:hypothetical protein